MAFQVGDFLLDFSGWRPPGNDYTIIKKAGAGGTSRYSAGAGNNDAATQWKLCEHDEIARTVSAGMDFRANSEWTTGRVTQRLVGIGHEERYTKGIEGRLRSAVEDLVPAGGQTRPHFAHPDVVDAMVAAGSEDGVADLAFWRSRGLNRGAVVAVSWDAAPVVEKWPAVDAYIANYANGLHGYYHPDCYAGTPYLKHAIARKLITVGWHPMAESWSGDILPYQPSTRTPGERAAFVARALQVTPARVIQTGNYWYSNNVDENIVVRTPVGSHLDAAAQPATPATFYKLAPGSYPSPNGEFRLIVGNDGAVTRWRHVPGTDHGEYAGTLFPAP